MNWEERMYRKNLTEDLHLEALKRDEIIVLAKPRNYQAVKCVFTDYLPE